MCVNNNQVKTLLSPTKPHRQDIGGGACWWKNSGIRELRQTLSRLNMRGSGLGKREVREYRLPSINQNLIREGYESPKHFADEKDSPLEAENDSPLTAHLVVCWSAHIMRGINCSLEMLDIRDSEGRRLSKPRSQWQCNQVRRS